MNTAPNKKEKNSATADRKKNNGMKRTMTTASGVPSGNADFELDNQQNGMKTFVARRNILKL